jgi:hypothetical protein
VPRVSIQKNGFCAVPKPPTPATGSRMSVIPSGASACV